MSPESLVHNNDLIIVGTVTEILPSRWTTDDGNCPDDPLNTIPAEATIVTPYILELDSAPILNRTGANLSSLEIAVLTEGGTINSDSIQNTNVPWSSYDIGEQVLLFATDLEQRPSSSLGGDWQNALPEGYGDGWIPQMKFTIVSDEIAVYVGGEVPLGELIDVIETLAHGVSVPPTATVTE